MAIFSLYTHTKIKFIIIPWHILNIFRPSVHRNVLFTFLLLILMYIPFSLFLLCAPHSRDVKAYYEFRSISIFTLNWLPFSFVSHSRYVHRTFTLSLAAISRFHHEEQENSENFLMFWFISVVEFTHFIFLFEERAR